MTLDITPAAYGSGERVAVKIDRDVDTLSPQWLDSDDDVITEVARDDTATARRWRRRGGAVTASSYLGLLRGNFVKPLSQFFSLSVVGE